MVCNLKLTTYEDIQTEISSFFGRYSVDNPVDYENLISLRNEIIENDKSESNSFNDDEFLEQIKTYTKANNISFNSTMYKNLLTKAGDITPALVSERFQIKNPADLNKFFNYHTSGVNYFKNKLKASMFNNLFLDLENKNYIETDEQANGQIIKYKNSLYKILVQKYNTGNNTTFEEDLFDKSGNIVNYENYKTVLNFIAAEWSENKIKKVKFNIPIKNVSGSHIKMLEEYSALIILNNFDKIIELQYSKYLKPQYLFKGSLENPTNKVKYIRNFQSLGAPGNFKDDHEAADVSHTSSDLIKMIADIIPMYDTNNLIIDGAYLGMNYIRQMSKIIKKVDRKRGSFSTAPTKKLERYFLKPAKAGESIEYNSLKNFFTILDEIKKPNNISSVFDIKSLLAFEMNKVAYMPYISYGKNEIEIYDFDKISKTIGHFKTTIAHTIINNNFELISTEGTDTEKKLNIQKATGVIITDGVLSTLVATARNDLRNSTTKILDNFIKEINNISLGAKKAADKLDDKFITVSEFIANAQKTSSTMDVFEAINNNKIASPISNFKNKEKNTIPVYRQTSLSSNDENSIEKFKTLHRGLGNNLFADSEILNGTFIRLEGTTDEDSKDTGKFSTEEGFYASFIGDFLKVSLKNNRDLGKHILIHPFPYSDKKTDYLKSINLNTVFDKNMFTNVFLDEYFKEFGEKFLVKSKKLREFTNKELDFLNYFYNKTYYSGLKTKIVSDLTKLFGVSSQKEIIDTLNSFNTYEDFFKFIQAHPELEITEGVHYKVYKGKYALNRVLFNVIEFYENSFQNYLDFHQKQKIKFVKDIENFPINQLKVIMDQIHMYHLNSKNDIIPESEVNNYKPNELINGNDINPYLDRYYILTNLIKTQYENITTKGSYLYVTKNSLNDSTEQEASDAFLAGSKRMVTHTASIQPYNTGTPNGVNKIIKVATIQDFTSPTANYSGDSKNQDSMDGSAYYEAFTAKLTENSLPGLGVKGTQKPFGTHLGAGYASAFKFAAMPITNALMRNSRGLGNAKIDIEGVQKRLSNNQLTFNDSSFTYDSFLDQNFNGEAISFSELMDAIDPNGLYFIKNGKYYKFEDFRYSKNQYIVDARLVDKFGRPVKTMAIAGDGKTQLREVITFFPQKINSVWDLFQMFGGADSYSLSKGVLIQSEKSLDLVTSYINNVGYTITKEELINGKHQYVPIIIQPLKDSLIGMLASKSAVKMGATNLNPKSSWLNNEPFATSEIDLTNFGMQQDYAHEADDSEVSEMSQVIAMLSALGNTTQYAEDVYKALEYIMQLSMDETEKILGPIKLLKEGATPKEITEAKNKLYKKLAQFVKNEFSKADTISSAQAVLDILTKTKDTQNVPFSDPKIFGLFSTNFLSNLNKNTIKRKFPGLGGILNPSVIQIYELPNGHKATWTDLLEEAVDLYPNENLSNNDLVDKFLNEQFENEIAAEEIITQIKIDLGISDSISPEQQVIIDKLLKTYKTSKSTVPTDIGLMDTVLIDNVEVYIDTPQILQQIYAANKPIRKIFGKSRDLKPDNITWQTNLNEVVQYHNFWTFDPVLLSTNFNPLDKKLNDFLLYMTGNADLSNGLVSADKSIATSAKIIVMDLLTKWTNRLSSAIAKGVMYPPLTINKNGDYDFETLFAGDKLVNKLDSNYFYDSKFLPISNYKKTNYEAIVPKLNKTVHELGENSLYKITKRGASYFENTVESTYDFNGDISEIDLFARTKVGNLGIKIVTQFEFNDLKNKAEKVTSEVDEETNITYRVTDNGERLYQIPKNTFIIKNGSEDVMIFVENFKNKTQEYTDKTTGEIKTTEIIVLNTELVSNFLKSMKPHSIQLFNPQYLSLNFKNNKLSPYRAIHKNAKTRKELEDNYVNEKYSTIALVSKMMFTSFLKSNRIISSRIPAQALQSVMSMDVVAFTEEDTNDVYVSLWQIFLQGSKI